MSRTNFWFYVGDRYVRADQCLWPTYLAQCLRMALGLDCVQYLPTVTVE